MSCNIMSTVCVVIVASVVQPNNNLVDLDVYRVALAAVSRVALPGSDAREVDKQHALIASTYDPSHMWRDFDADTVKAHPYLDPRRRLAYANPETVEAFLQAIRVRESLPKQLESGGSFRLFDEASLPHDSQGWAEFQRRTGLGVGAFSVSRIGYDASRTQALVYVSYQCGALCASGRFILLERIAAEWRVVKIDLHVES